MCGILFAAHLQANHKADDPAFAAPLKARGPDNFGHVLASAGDVELVLAASLLQLRGVAPSTSPLLGSDRSVLCFNGEVFGGLPVPAGANDAQQLLRALQHASGQQAALAALLSQLRGPWALVYWHASSQRVYFGRDVMGRRSLLIHAPDADDARLILCSVGPNVGPCSGVGSDGGRCPPAGLQPAPAALLRAASRGAAGASTGEEGTRQPGGGWHEVPPGVYCWDRDSLQRLLTQPPPGGGSIEAWLQRALTPLPWRDPLVVALAQYRRAPELVQPPWGAAGGSAAGAAAPSAAPRRPDGCAEAVRAAALRVVDALQASVRIRCCCADHAAHAPPSLRPGPGPPPLMVLFSGGVDSMLLAALAHRVLPPGAPIELSNVCFDAGASPDRVSARAALCELAAWAPEREWRLIEVDATLAEVDSLRPRLLGLLQPAGTVMDLNIGAALWLAARAAGVLRLPPAAAAARAGAQPGGGGVRDGEAYTSRARVALLGHGADEQFGGYGRHRTSFREGGWQGLAEEMALDMHRLWRRNLGRDDRLVADHGREGRHPFLDEALMELVLGLPLWLVTDLTQPPGVGDKRLLREALRHLGLPKAAAREKRAIQFGTRIGRLTNVRDFGSGRAANRVNAGSVAVTQLPSASGGK